MITVKESTRKNNVHDWIRTNRFNRSDKHTEKYKIVSVYFLGFRLFRFMKILSTGI